MSDARGIRRSPTVLVRWVGDRVILARSDEEGFEVLEGPGAAVWDLLEEGATAPGIVDALAPSFGASREVIAADVDRLLEELLGRGLAEETRRGRG